MLSEYKTNAKRLIAADRAAMDGDMAVAIDIYNRLALSRPKTAVNTAALERLKFLPKLARRRMDEIDRAIPGNDRVTTTGDVLRAAAGDEDSVKWRKIVLAAFEQYDRLEEQCEHLRQVSSEIRPHVSDQRKRLKYSLVLNEAEASELYEIGRDYKTESQYCCAFLAFEQAAKLGPSPSAQMAHDQLSQLRKDPAVIAAAKTCSELQWCHKTYRTAEKLVEERPERARELLAQIISRAPPESEVYSAARRQIHDLGYAR